LNVKATRLSIATKAFSAWSQLEFRQRVRLFSDQFGPTHAGYGAPEDFKWSFKARFKLCRLEGSTSKWVRWSREEKAAWLDDYAPEKEQEIETYWLPQPWLAPVMVVEGADNLFYAWDGNHRIGVAFTVGMRSVPAIVGFRRR
jgi:hypothetical protein